MAQEHEEVEVYDWLEANQQNGEEPGPLMVMFLEEMRKAHREVVKAGIGTAVVATVLVGTIETLFRFARPPERTLISPHGGIIAVSALALILLAVSRPLRERIVRRGARKAKQPFSSPFAQMVAATITVLDQSLWVALSGFLFAMASYNRAVMYISAVLTWGLLLVNFPRFAKWKDWAKRIEDEEGL